MRCLDTLRIGVLALQGAVQEHVARFQRIRCQRYEEGGNIGEQKTTMVESFPVKNKTALDQCDALVIPGGESTTMALVAKNLNLWEPLQEFMDSGKPVWGTCAGLILCAKELTNPVKDQETLDAIDAIVTRNYFGRQIASAEKPIAVETDSRYMKDILDFAEKHTWSIGSPNASPNQSIAERSLPVYGTGTTGETGDSLREKLKSSTGVFIRAPIVEKTGSSTEVFASVVDSLNNAVTVGIQESNNRLFTAFHPELTSNWGWHQYFVAMVLNHYTLKS